jgi:two-component system copper resistance phosphate regulon response regulator CusR
MRILVAEDHPTLARSIAQGLRDEGYAVDLTMDGEEAMHFALTNQYGCIVLDIMLPGRDGWSVLKTLRQKGSATPVVFLTAKDAVDDRVRGLDMGADDYVVKPFNWAELLARVRAAIRRPHGHRTASLTIADLEIDTVGKVVRRGGSAVELTAREYALLEYLAHREGQVVSRTDIWEQLYGHDDATTSNVVDVYIGYLRNKIDRDHPVKLIHTRRGLGYVLTASP